MELPRGGRDGVGQIGYSATSLTQNQGPTPSYSLSDPFPNGLVQPSGNSLGLLTGTGGDFYFVNPEKGAPRVQQYSVDFQRELPGNINVSVGYTGLKRQQPELERIVQRNELAHQHQPARSEVPIAAEHDDVGAEPVLRSRRPVLSPMRNNVDLAIGKESKRAPVRLQPDRRIRGDIRERARRILSVLRVVYSPLTLCAL